MTLQPLTREEQVAQQIAQVLQSLKNAEKDGQVTQATSPSFAREIAVLERALKLLGVDARF
ncbi:hypothetical protein CR51_11590 [Caballeronia megalochromosomata]|nr:hypothetical protein CR51_11590 [Caballeronia megalochromosomata]